LVPYTRSESDSARPLWSLCLCHPNAIISIWTRSAHTSKVTPKDSWPSKGSSLECIQMHTKMTGPVPISPNTDQLRTLKRIDL
jgi:hypothetical protein